MLNSQLRSEEDQATFNFISFSTFILLVIFCFDPANRVASAVDRERDNMTRKEREDTEGFTLVAWLLVGAVIPFAGAWFSAEMFLKHLG